MAEPDKVARDGMGGAAGGEHVPSAADASGSGYAAISSPRGAAGRRAVSSPTLQRASSVEHTSSGAHGMTRPRPSLLRSASRVVLGLTGSVPPPANLEQPDSPSGFNVTRKGMTAHPKVRDNKLDVVRLICSVGVYLYHNLFYEISDTVLFLAMLGLPMLFMISGASFARFTAQRKPATFALAMVMYIFVAGTGMCANVVALISVGVPVNVFQAVYQLWYMSFLIAFCIITFGITRLNGRGVAFFAYLAVLLAALAYAMAGLFGLGIVPTAFVVVQKAACALVYKFGGAHRTYVLLALYALPFTVLSAIDDGNEYLFFKFGFLDMFLAGGCMHESATTRLAHHILRFSIFTLPLCLWFHVPNVGIGIVVGFPASIEFRIRLLALSLNVLAVFSSMGPAGFAKVSAPTPAVRNWGLFIYVFHGSALWASGGIPTKGGVGHVWAYYAFGAVSFAVFVLTMPTVRWLRRTLCAGSAPRGAVRIGGAHADGGMAMVPVSAPSAV